MAAGLADENEIVLRRMRATSVAESGRSLGMGEFERLHARASFQAALNLAGAGCFEPGLHRFCQHRVSFLVSLALAGNAEFRAKGNKPFLFLFDHGGQRRQRDDFSIFENPARLHRGDFRKP